jgi:hypothetical protein
MRLGAALAVFLTVATLSAQKKSVNRTVASASVACPGGKVVAELDLTANPKSLDMLVPMSDLIVRGTVLRSLPSFNRNPDIATAIETDAIFSVTSTLHGIPVVAGSAITLAQEGGKTGQCEEIVRDDELVKEGEEYVLFLQHDDRTMPLNLSGFPRYFAAGRWSGKAKIEGQKIHFLPSAGADLHKLDDMDAAAFVSLLETRINLWFPRK